MIRWWIKRYLLSKHSSIRIAKEDIWVDSDSEGEESFPDVDENSDFWAVMRIDPEQLEYQQQEVSQARAAKKTQTIRLEGDEVEQYLAFKQQQEENRQKRLSVSTNSTETPSKVFVGENSTEAVV